MSEAGFGEGDAARASVVGGAPWPTCPSPFNLAAHVLDRAAHHPDKVALVIARPDGATRWRYGQLRDTVRRLAGGLLGLGLQPGARVLLRLGSTVEFPLTYLAAIAADLVPVPTSAALTASEAGAIRDELRPDLIVAGPGVALPPDPACPVLDAAELMALAKAPPAPFATGDPERPAYIVYTSGTSGRPRGVVHAHRAIWARGMMTEGWYGLTGDDRLFHAGAFNWTYTLGTGLLDPWTAGATAIIPADGTEARQLPLLIARHEATIFAAAPGIYRRALRSPLPALPRLRHGLSAGEKMAPDLRREWTAATGRPVHEAFGMTECSTFVSGSPARPAAEDAAGYPQPGRRVAILDAAGDPVARGTAGTIAVDADDPGLMLGYLDAPEETAARFTADGAWFLTGDTGVMESDGAIRYLGRTDDMMNAGGIRVSPVEVEAALAAHPGIGDVAAAEVAVRPGVTVIAAFYTASGPLEEAELARFATERLATYKRPRLFVRQDALPRGANGKLLRRNLREGYEASHGQD